MNAEPRILANADIEGIVIATREGHRHLRTTITLRSGEAIVLQGATVANLVRVYVEVKNRPRRQRVRLVGREIAEDERKEGFAGWRLLEEDGEELS